MSEPTPGADALRDLARQRRPHQTPAEGEMPAETPTWVGPDRHPELHRPTVPGQSSPDHDTLGRRGNTAAEVGTAPALLQEAHWSGQRAGRSAVGLMLLAALLATVAAGVLTLQDPTGDNASLLGICALVTVGVWAIMATTRPMTVDLKGSTLTVHHRDTTDSFDLGDPFQPVQLRGAVGSPTWSLALGKLDGTTVVVGSRTVKAAQLHPVVMHYRARAERQRRERDQRFGR